jgi:hypothetical protein
MQEILPRVFKRARHPVAGRIALGPAEDEAVAGQIGAECMVPVEDEPQRTAVRRKAGDRRLPRRGVLDRTRRLAEAVGMRPRLAMGSVSTSEPGFAGKPGSFV